MAEAGSRGGDSQNALEKRKKVRWGCSSFIGLVKVSTAASKCAASRELSARGKKLKTAF
jgi:hypothetical protein